MQTQAGGRAPGLVVGQFQVLVRIKAIETLINFPKKKKKILVYLPNWWAAPHRPTRPVLALPQYQRKSLELGTETPPV